MADLTEEDGEDGDPSDEELLEEAKERYGFCEQFWKPIQEQWRQDAKFRALEQWPQNLLDIRNKPGKERPCLTVDKCNQYVRQVVNDGRQNRPGVKVRPIDDKGDPEIAEAYQGMVRHICDRSNADEAFDTALDHAAGNGYGFFRVLTDYAHKNTFNQEIIVQRVRNPLMVMLDPNARAADGSDAKYGFVVDELPKEEFKRKYPDAKFTDWQSDAAKYSDGWVSAENVRFAEYYYTVETPRTMHLLADGTTTDDDTYQTAVAQQVAVPAIVDTREIPECEVKWCRLSGAEILEKNEWKGIYVPLIPVYGNEVDIDGKVMYSGLIRAAKDAQRLYNFSRSAYAERVALAPKAPWVAAKGQIEGNEEEWENANQANVGVLTYEPMDINGTPVPPPQRVQASDIPEGFARDMQLSEHDIQASMGMYNASVGEKSNEKSGKAIMARQREGDTATFHYQDNLNRAIRYLGRILVDLIPKVYDSPRVIRILGEDGESTPAEINPNQEQPVLKMAGKMIYNLNVGTYDVSVSAGPSYTTKRQEAVEAQMQLAQAVPEIWKLAGDLMIRNMDWPGAEEIADRWKLMLPPQVLQAEQGQQQLPPEVQQAMQAVQQGQQQLQQAHQQLMEIQQQVEADKAANDADRAKLDAARKELEAARKVLDSRYEELSAKLELQAMKIMQPVPQTMPAGKEEPAIAPDSMPPQPQPASAGFFTPGG